MSKIFVASAFLTILVIALAITSGCRSALKQQPVIVKVSGNFPGASPGTVNGVVFPFLYKAAALVPQVRDMTCISRAGQFDAYFVVDSAAGEQDLIARLKNMGSLPPGVGPLATSRCSSIPSVVPKQVPIVVVQFDLDKCASLGLLVSDASNQLGDIPESTPVPERLERLEHFNLCREQEKSRTINVFRLMSCLNVYNISETALKNMKITTGSGSKVPLTAVATLKVEESPDCIVSTYPYK